MSDADILKDLTEIARRKLGYKGDLRIDTHLIEDMDLDSILLLTLAVEVEDHFCISLDEADEENIILTSDLVDIISKKISKPS